MVYTQAYPQNWWIGLVMRKLLKNINYQIDSWFISKR